MAQRPRAGAGAGNEALTQDSSSRTAAARRRGGELAFPLPGWGPPRRRAPQCRPGSQPTGQPHFAALAALAPPTSRPTQAQPGPRELLRSWGGRGQARGTARAVGGAGPTQERGRGGGAKRPVAVHVTVAAPGIGRLRAGATSELPTHRRLCGGGGAGRGCCRRQWAGKGYQPHRSFPLLSLNHDPIAPRHCTPRSY
ncbi:uncharacterized protein LOC114676240 [Macaca mulatta]